MSSWLAKEVSDYLEQITSAQLTMLFKKPRLSYVMIFSTIFCGLIYHLCIQDAEYIDGQLLVAAASSTTTAEPFDTVWGPKENVLAIIAEKERPIKTEEETSSNTPAKPSHSPVISQQDTKTPDEPVESKKVRLTRHLHPHRLYLLHSTYRRRIRWKKWNYKWVWMSYRNTPNIHGTAQSWWQLRSCLHRLLAGIS